MLERFQLRFQEMLLGHPFQFSATEAPFRDTKALPSSICPSSRSFPRSRIRKSGWKTARKSAGILLAGQMLPFAIFHGALFLYYFLTFTWTLYILVSVRLNDNNKDWYQTYLEIYLYKYLSFYQTFYCNIKIFKICKCIS